MSLALSGEVTQQELLSHIPSVFLRGSANKTDLKRAAFRGGARPERLAVLDGLPERGYGSVLDVCSELRDVPFGIGAVLHG